MTDVMADISPAMAKLAKQEVSGGTFRKGGPRQTEMSFDHGAEVKVKDAKALVQAFKEDGFKTKDGKASDDDTIIYSKKSTKYGIHIQWYSDEGEREADGVPDGVCMMKWFG